MHVDGHRVDQLDAVAGVAGNEIAADEGRVRNCGQRALQTCDEGRDRGEIGGRVVDEARDVRQRRGRDRARDRNAVAVVGVVVDVGSIARAVGADAVARNRVAVPRQADAAERAAVADDEVLDRRSTRAVGVRDGRRFGKTEAAEVVAVDLDAIPGTRVDGRAVDDDRRGNSVEPHGQRDARDGVQERDGVRSGLVVGLLDRSPQGADGRGRVRRVADAADQRKVAVGKSAVDDEIRGGEEGGK